MSLARKMSDRIPWDHYFMSFARAAAERGTCSRARVGAVIVTTDHAIVATGYNGAPRGLPHCTEVGCLEYVTINPDGSQDRYCNRTIHAEINAITQAATNGVSIRGTVMYVTHTPCVRCCLVLLNSGVYRIVYDKPYRLELTAPLIAQSGRVQLVQLAAREEFCFVKTQ